MTPLDLTKAPPRSPRQELHGLCMLPRMIDIARAMLLGGEVGDYQIGRGVSRPVLATFALTTSQFVEIVRDATTDREVAERLLSNSKGPLKALDRRLRSLTVADVPEELRVEFHQLYGRDLPLDRLVFDVLEADDAQKFGAQA
jgi:Domain of unknown function (DUF5069)